jgi:hypothetical protein
VSTVAERVARGAALLDETVPGWDQRIDLDLLDVDCCERCILGQLFASQATAWPVSRGFGAGTVALGIDDTEIEELGFDDTSMTVAEVTAEWRRVITGRRAQVPA